MTAKKSTQSLATTRNDRQATAQPNVLKSPLKAGETKTGWQAELGSEDGLRWWRAPTARSTRCSFASPLFDRDEPTLSRLEARTAASACCQQCYWSDGQNARVSISSRSIAIDDDKSTMFALLLDNPVMGGHPQWGYLSDVSEVPRVVVVSQVFEVVTNQSKRNQRVVTDLANAARCGVMANSACTLTLLAIAPDPGMPFVADLGARAAKTPIPYMGVIKPWHFAGHAVFTARALDKMVAPGCVAGDERRPPRLGQQQDHTRNESCEGAIHNPDGEGIGACEQHPQTHKRAKDSKRDRYPGDLAKHPGQVRLSHGHSVGDRILPETYSIPIAMGRQDISRTINVGASKQLQDATGFAARLPC